MVTGVICEAEEHHPYDGQVAIATELVLSLPRVNQLHLRSPAFDSLRDFAFMYEHLWTSLELSYVDIEGVFGETILFTALEALKCRFLLTSSYSQSIHLPPRLTHLDIAIDTPNTSIFPIVNVLSSPIRSLCIPIHDFVNFPDFADLPQLHHLEVRSCNYGNDNVSRLSDTITRCQFLTSLTLELSPRFRHEEVLDLFKRLPKRLTRFHLPTSAPFRPLKRFLGGEVPTSLRIIGISKEGVAEELAEEEVEILLKLCRTKEIEVQYLAQG